MQYTDFQLAILEGIPSHLPPTPVYNTTLNHAPRRKDILNKQEKALAVRNALRYFPVEHHSVLAKEFALELQEYGRIYAYRYKPTYPISARNIEAYPHKSKHCAAIMLMLSNNLDHAVAQHPDELITYGGNGAVFSTGDNICSQCSILPRWTTIKHWFCTAGILWVCFLPILMLLAWWLPTE